MLGSRRSGQTEALLQRVAQRWCETIDGDRILLLTADRRSSRRLSELIEPIDGGTFGRLQPTGVPGFMQKLITRHWPLVADRYEIDQTLPTFLSYDLQQLACLEEFRRDPGALQRLTIREQRAVVQIVSTMDIAAGQGLDLVEAWRRIGVGLGLEGDHPIVQDAYKLTSRLRQRFLKSGTLTFDLQVEAAGWLLQCSTVTDDLLQRYDLISIDSLDDFVPLMVRRLAALAARANEAVISASTDGGVRWILGADVDSAIATCAKLLAGDFRLLWLRQPRSPLARTGIADALAAALTSDRATPRIVNPRIHLHHADNATDMAGLAIECVVDAVRSGVPPARISLVMPYLNSLTSSKIAAGLDAAAVPFSTNRPWQTFADDPATRLCLTALRLTAGDNGEASPIEQADLFCTLLDWNPIRAHKFLEQANARKVGTSTWDEEPEIQRLRDWIRSFRSQPAAIQLTELARTVFAPHNEPERRHLVEACYELANIAERFEQFGSRQIEPASGKLSFLEYVDSEILTSGVELDLASDAVVLTSPYGLLTSGRVSTVQCWLDVASDGWWDPPFLVLNNPRALAGEPLSNGYAADEESRTRILARLLRQLASACDGWVEAFSSRVGPDGFTNDSKLAEALEVTAESATWAG